LYKGFVEDAPLLAMQALYLSLNFCDQGLNPIIIVSLYFNSVCLLYSLSNICSGKTKNESQLYKKELHRLKDYYDSTHARIIAEFYIEDSA
jgi:hypothetical protein